MSLEFQTSAKFDIRLSVLNCIFRILNSAQGKVGYFWVHKYFVCTGYFHKTQPAYLLSANKCCDALQKKNKNVTLVFFALLIGTHLWQCFLMWNVKTFLVQHLILTVLFVIRYCFHFSASIILEQFWCLWFWSLRFWSLRCWSLRLQSLRLQSLWIWVFYFGSSTPNQQNVQR